MNDAQLKNLREDISVVRSLTSSLISNEVFNRALEGQARMIIEKINKVDAAVLAINAEYKATKEAEVKNEALENELELKNPPTQIPSPSNVNNPSNPLDTNKEAQPKIQGVNLL